LTASRADADPDRAEEDFLAQPFPLGRSDLFGVIETGNPTPKGKDDGGSHYWTGKRSSSGLIQTRDAAISASPSLRLEFVGGAH
jgi:hypothetical protein